METDHETGKQQVLLGDDPVESHLETDSQNVGMKYDADRKQTDTCSYI